MKKVKKINRLKINVKMKNKENKKVVKIAIKKYWPVVMIKLGVGLITRKI